MAFHTISILSRAKEYCLAEASPYMFEYIDLRPVMADAYNSAHCSVSNFFRYPPQTGKCSVAAERQTADDQEIANAGTNKYTHSHKN